MEQEKYMIESGQVKKQRPCPVCLEMIDEDVTICPYCDEPTLFKLPHARSKEPEALQLKEPSSSGMSLWKKILIGIGCVFVALVIIGMLLPDDEGEEAEGTEFYEEATAISDDDAIAAAIAAAEAAAEAEENVTEEMDGNIDSADMSLYDLLSNGNDDLSDPTWKQRLTRLVGNDNYRFMLQQYMGTTIQREDGMMGRYASFTFEGHTKEDWNDGYVVSYSCGDGHEHLEVDITRNGTTRKYEETR